VIAPLLSKRQTETFRIERLRYDAADYSGDEMNMEAEMQMIVKRGAITCLKEGFF